MVLCLTFSLKYSASFLEGRLDGHNSLYLDETRAYATADNITLGPSFTIACWIELVPSDPHLRGIVQNDLQIPGFIFGVNTNNQLQLTYWVSNASYIYTGGKVVERQWVHVAVSFVRNTELFFFINGFKISPTGNSSYPWDNTTGLLEIGRSFDPDQNKHFYFHGYLSDLFIFGRSLGAEDIGKLMGKDKCPRHLLLLSFLFVCFYTGSPSSKYGHRGTSALLRNIRNKRICMRKNLSFL